MKFFVLVKEIGGRDIPSGYTEFSYADGSQTGDWAESCPVCGKCIGSLPWLPPFRVELETRDSCYGDLVVGVSDDMLISQKLKDVIKSKKLQGLIGFDPVEVVQIKKRKKFSGNPPTYYRVNASRARAAIDAVASELEWRGLESFCSECRQYSILERWKRAVIEPGTWDGEDFFVARGLSGTVMVTERVVSLCQEHSIANTHFIPAENYSGDLEPWGNMSKAREMLSRPIDANLIERIRANGVVLRFEPSTGYMVIKNIDGSVEVCRPDAGVEFFRRY